jgi:hypothetical protein
MSRAWPSLQAMREAALMSGLPAVILLATRVAELRAGYRSSPLPPPSAPLDSGTSASQRCPTSSS